MAQPVPCRLPKFSPSSVDGPKRPVSMRVKTSPSQTTQLLSLWQQGQLSSLLQATWALLLYRYTGCEDVCFGYQHLGAECTQRASNDASTKSSIFHLSVKEHESIQQVLRKVGRKGHLTDTLEKGPRKEGDRSDYELFNTTLIIRVCTGSTHRARDAFVQPALAITLPEECRTRLHVKILEQDVGIFVEWWNQDMSMEQAKSIANHFEQTLARLLYAEEVAVEDLNVISEQDWRRICQFNSVPPESPNRCIHEVIYEQTLLRPEREAVCSWDGSLTYRELDLQASKVAAYLLEHGVKPETSVAVCFDKSKWYIVAVLGVLKAGGAFVPLDPTHPESRLQFLVHSVQANIMLCARDRVDKLSNVAEHIVPLDDEALIELAPAVDTSVLSPEVRGSNAAYVIFTSGSTGEPKGTLMEHKSYVASSVAHAPRLRIDSESRLLQFAAHTFDASLVDILTVLMQGACICIPSEDERLNDIVKAINNTRVNHASLTPSFIDFIDIADVPGLETLALVGEAMSQSHIETWSKVNLLNGFGPTEAAVTAAINSNVTLSSDSRDIGFPTGAYCWIVDPDDHDRLVPVGCVGEMLLEGPTLARGYLNNPEKTSESFIYDPAWTNYDGSESPGRRFYKTGDLVRYNSEKGSLTYLGRKDTQIKLHGQRVELGEIEDNLNSDSDIKHCLVLLPKTGFAEGRLVAVLSLSALVDDDNNANVAPLKLVENQKKPQLIAAIRERLSARLPAYMIPAVWMCVEAMPVLASRKLDRKATASWVAEMENDPEVRISQKIDGNDATFNRSASPMEDHIATIWSRILNIPKHNIPLDESFLSLGGDSIAAITCMGFCKKKGIGINVQEILRSKSIKELATRAKEIEQPAAYEEVIGRPFDLSPIQKLHFMVRREGQGHFNQSVLTRLNGKIGLEDLRRSLETLIERHSMLRARLIDQGPEVELQQVITSDVKGSYRWHVHEQTCTAAIESSVAESQSSINAFVGPVIAIDTFCENGRISVLSIVAHHLVVDIVSWRIMLEDLEDLLLNGPGTTSQNDSLPFQTWCDLQTERCQVLPKEDISMPAPELSYWAMESHPITYGEVDCEGFEVDLESTTSLLMNCHDSLQTEPIDVFLAALLHSFRQTFTERALPIIYNEGHGREVWDPSIDISRTVGWFTTLYPIMLSETGSDDIVETVVRVKDVRRRVLDNGRQEFAQRMCIGERDRKSTHAAPMEMSFNYVGQHRDLQRQDGLFQLMNQMAGETGRGGGAADFGEDTPRFALFEISAMAAHGKLRFTFSFNKYMDHQLRIRDWISCCHDTLKQVGPKLQSLTPRPTLCTFPMLSLTYKELENVLPQRLRSIGVDSFAMIEDIYPCTPMQESILLSRTRDESLYAVHNTFEVRVSDSKPDIDRLAAAWKAVVSRHSLLRTVFVQGLTKRDIFSQVVLKSSDLNLDVMSCPSDDDVLSVLGGRDSINADHGRPPNRFTICATATGKVFCRLELSHACMDGFSISIILQDLQCAYHGNLDRERTPMFKNYVQHLRESSHTASMEYWKEYLSNPKPSHFPILNDGQDSTNQLQTMHLSLDFYDTLQKACEENGFTLSTAFSAAWGLTIRSFCNTDDACFLYMASLRDLSVEDLETVVGPVINLLTCRMKVLDNEPLIDVLLRMQQDYMEQVPYRQTPLIDIQRALKLSDTMLCNTGLSYRRLPPTNQNADGEIQFLELGSIYDPAEFPIFVNVEVSDQGASVDLNYWTMALSDRQAESVAKTFIKHLETITRHQNAQMSLVDGLSDWHLQQIMTWNKTLPETVEKCAHEVLSQKAKTHPDQNAVSAWDGELTYSRLDELSSALSAYLMQLGVGQGSLVPIELPRSVWRVVAIAAVLKSGGVCIPVIEERLQDTLNDDLITNEVQVALASPTRAHLMEGTIPYVIPIDSSLFDYLPRSKEQFVSSSQPEDDAYVVYSFDEKSTPKIFMLDHQTILTRAQNFASKVGLNTRTRLFQLSDHTSDMFVQEVVGAWSQGACICIPSDSESRDPSLSINALHANMISTTPQIASDLQPSDVPDVQTLVVHAKHVDLTLKTTWSGKVQLHTFYGKAAYSSTCVHASYPDAHIEAAPISSGVGCRLWIVDPQDHELLVPIGCPGELIVEGPVISDHHRHTESSASQRLIERPKWALNIQNETGDDSMDIRKMFKTGDLVRYNSDGTLAYIAEQDERDQSQEVKAKISSADWWKSYLADAEACIFPSLQYEKRHRDLVSFAIPARNVTKIHAFCQKFGVDVGSLLHVAWGLVLRCYTGSEEVCLGYRHMGQEITPIRLNLKDDMPLEGVVCKLATDVLHCLQHPLPLLEIQKACKLESKMFNTLFDYSEMLNDGGQDQISIDMSDYMIGVSARATDSLTTVSLICATDCLSEANIADILECYQHVLDSTLNAIQHNRCISDVEFLTEASCKQIQKWNAVLPDRPTRCANEIIEEQVYRLPPSTPAICSWDGEFTYEDLEFFSTRLADYLREIGVKPETFVPLCFEKSAWAVISQVAILKAGGAFVSLDPAHPEERMKNMIQDLGAKIILCSAKYQQKAAGVCDLAFSVYSTAIMELPSAAPASQAAIPTNTNSAYAIFTSGTTGKPKATVIEHAGLCSISLSVGETYGFGPGTRCMQFSSYTWDVSILESIIILMNGGCVCVPSEEERMNDLAGAIRRMEANLLIGSPSVANTLDPKAVPSLRTILAGGEKTTASHVERWSDRCVINAYGPSEATIMATSCMIVGKDGIRHTMDYSSIGTPHGGRAWVVDPHNYNRLLPVGAIGELVLEGCNVARGYLNNEQKTKEAFIRDADWARHHGLREAFRRQERMYKTGDLVHYNEDGSLSFVARKDTQIKLHGQRVELGEIEQQCIRFLPPGTEVAVDLVNPEIKTVASCLAVFFTIDKHQDQEGFWPHDSSSNILVSMAENRNDALKQQLIVFLKQSLPSAFIPKLFVPVKHLPLTTAGKLDRRKLKSLVESLSREKLRSYGVSSSREERILDKGLATTLMTLWEEVIGLDPESIAAGDNFFEIGGDSYSAMKLVSAASSCGISLKVTDIYNHPILADLAMQCKDMEESSKIRTVEPFSLLPESVDRDEILQEVADKCYVQKDSISDIYPCSPAQEGLLTLSLKQQGAYIAQPVFRLSDKIDLQLFKEAWQQVVDELDILRTRIVHTDSTNFLQAVLKRETISWKTVATFEELYDEESELSRYEGGPLTGYAIVKTDLPSDIYFVWTVHHALYDGWMLPIIFKKIEETYSRGSSESRTLQYNQFIWHLLEQDMSKSDNFWKSYLSNMESSPFPQSKSSNPDSFRVGNTYCNRMEIPRSSGTGGPTLAEVIRAAWAIVISVHTGTSDVCFGETLMGRNATLTGISEIAGPVLTTVPTRIQVDNGKLLSHYLQSIRQLTTDMLPYQHAGLHRISKLSQDTFNACKFQNILVIQTDEGKLNDDLWIPEGNRNKSDFFTHPLTTECKIKGSRVEFTVHYDELVMDGWVTERLICQFMSILHQLLMTSTGDTRRVGDLDVSSALDKFTISSWNKRTPLCIERCVHDVIHDQCSNQPKAPAVCAWDGQLSYEETFNLASSFAKYLVSRGVGPETLVPFCLDKSLSAVISMLGILIAGGAFVPLDPSHPTSRHKEILKEVDAQVILCSPHYHNRYAGIVKTIIPISKDTIRAYGAIGKGVKCSSTAEPSNVSFAIFTSGSTGRPKGILIDHCSLVSSAMAFGPVSHMNKYSRVFQFASLTFDAGVMEVLVTLMHGACVCIPSEEERLNDVAGAIRRMNVSWSFLTPSIASILDPSAVPSLKVLVCGGEKLSKEVVTKWAHRVQLVNGYGPTETTIFAVMNDVSANPEPSCIGYGIPCTLTWIVDPENHDRLYPLGAVGELVLEGPALAREYLKNPEKTAAAFVNNPAWMEQFPSAQKSTRRIYKTGDLVKYNPDGSIECIGRKDHQVKLHGQRMELGEIEHRLYEDSRVRHAVVILPRLGPFRDRLVTILSLESLTMDKSIISDGTCELVSRDMMGSAYSELTEIQKGLERQLPIYMVPQTWAVLKNLPMLVSGKLDRKRIANWIEVAGEEIHDRIMEDYDTIKRGNVEEKKETNDGSIVDTLRDIFVQILNISSEKVDTSRSFVSLGGDSITGMAVVSRARKHGLSLTLHNVLQSKSMKELALASGKRVQTIQVKERHEELFELSPIQRLYFESASNFGGASRFNQGMTVRLNRKIPAETVKRAVEAVVQRHSMLRARFVKSSDGKWQQRIGAGVGSSYQFRSHTVTDKHEMRFRLAESQNLLDIQAGPICAGDLFELQGHGQILALVVHHLCVDMVSWRIILQDIQDCIELGSLSPDKTLSFQSWCELQTREAQEGCLVQLPFQAQQPNLEYWGMEKARNLYGHVKMETFTITQEATSFILGSCHDVFRTETLEVLLAAVIHSFNQVFTDRDAPMIYNEGHGREPWDDSIDVSRTVGWFTTFCPLRVGKSKDLFDTLRYVKDVRRAISGNGRSYFAQDLLHTREKGGVTQFPVPLEIIFNYLGQLQQLEREDSLFKHYDDASSFEALNSASDMGPETPRFALFELSAIVIKDRLHMSFTYNRQTKHETRIQQWVSECKKALEEGIPRLQDWLPEPTLSDYPLLSITYDGLKNMMRDILPRAGIESWERVEDIYPCSPVQEGILLSQLRDPHGYMFHAIIEVRHGDGSTRVEANKVRKAWSMVVERHPILRTMFIDSYCKGGSFDQLVLRVVEDEVVEFECDERIAFETLDNIKLANINAKRLRKLHQQLTICTTTSGRVFLKFEINHAIIDGASVDLLLRDLQMAYDGQLPPGTGPLFSDYIKHAKATDPKKSLTHWVEYLSDVRPCHLSVSPAAGVERRLNSVMMNFDRFSELQKFCECNSVTLANLTLSAWAIVLWSFTGMNDVCFGYLSAGRDSPVPGIQDAVGIFINMLCCRVKFEENQKLCDISRRVQDDFFRALPYQNCSLAQIQHEIGREGQMLFNTALSIQNHAVSENKKESTISFEFQRAHDPTEYPVTVNVETTKGREGILIRYWADAVSERQAQGLADAIAQIFTSFIDRPSASISELNVHGPSPDVALRDSNSSKRVSLNDEYLQALVDKRIKKILYEMFHEGMLNVPALSEKILNETNTLHFKVPHDSYHQTVITHNMTTSDSMPTLADVRGTSELENQLWRLWSAALGLPSDNVIHHASFFKLGGDSITAMKMVGAAREEGLMITVADVFNNPVFDDMLATICSRGSTPSCTPDMSNDSTLDRNTESPVVISRSPSPEGITVVKPIELNEASVQNDIGSKIGLFRGEVADILPVTDFQALSLTATLFKSRWMLNYFYLDGKGALDTRRLTESFLQVTDAFDILRTVFVCFHGQCFQVILRKMRPEIFIHDTEGSLDEYTASLQQRDRAHEPRQGEQFVQFYIVRQKGTDHHRILIRMSHAQYDGVCLPRIMSAIKMGYEGLPIPPAPSFANYMRMLPGTVTPEHYQHWKKLLHNSTMTEVIRRNSPNSFQHIGAFTEQNRTIEIPTTALDNVTIATVMQSAWALTLAKLSSQSDVIFGLATSGRNTTIPGIENVVGPCLNTLPVRVKFGDRWTGLDLFRYLQDQQVANMAYESLGFREIIRQCTNWPESTYFTTTVFHQSLEYEGEMQLDDHDYRMGGVGVIDNFVDLTLFSKQTSTHHLLISLGYSLKGPIQPSYATKVLDMVCETVQSLVANPSIALPSPRTLRSLPSQVVADLSRQSDEHFLSSHLNTRSISEVLVHSDIVSRIWKQVLPNRTPELPRPPFQLNSSFFELGGDVFNMAQVVWLLEQEGIRVHLEDLLDHASFLGHMAVLALQNTKQKSLPHAPTLDVRLPPTPPPRPASPATKGGWKPLGKAVTLARKISRWNLASKSRTSLADVGS